MHERERYTAGSGKRFRFSYPSPKNEYRRRDLALRELGFSSYSEYLGSPLWKDIRRRTLDRDGCRCVACGGPALQVHHRSYSKAVLLGFDLAFLVSICGECHRGIEVSRSGKKLTLADANARLNTILLNRKK